MSSLSNSFQIFQKILLLINLHITKHVYNGGTPFTIGVGITSIFVESSATNAKVFWTIIFA
jgi:hypothetical protein